MRRMLLGYHNTGIQERHPEHGHNRRSSMYTENVLTHLDTKPLLRRLRLGVSVVIS